MSKQKMKQELKKYLDYLEVEANKFKLTSNDLSNLFDLLEMVDTPPEVNIDLRKTLKLNKMDKWFYDFRDKIESIVIWDWEGKKK